MADTADNYLSWSNVQTVQFHSRDQERSVEITHAKRTAISRREAVLLGIGVSSRTVSWSLPVALLDGLEPQKTDKVVEEDGTEWIVDPSVELLGHGSRYRFLATRSR